MKIVDNKLALLIKSYIPIRLWVVMCGNDFFDPIPSHSHDRIFTFPPIPIVVYKNIPILSRNKILKSNYLPIPFPHLVFEISN